VHLNIYDLGTNPVVGKINHALMAVGTGVFHVGVEVYGTEWSYGYDESGTGVFYVEPGASSKNHFREALNVGTTNLSREQVMHIIGGLAGEWLGCDYDCLRKNCASFAVVLVEKLGAGRIPTWVSNLAGAGASLHDSFMQLATTARSMMVAAAAKASETDAQYNIRGAAKAKTVDMAETCLSFGWYCSGAAALQPLDKQHHRMDRATKAAETGASAFQQGVELVILNPSEANGKYCLTAPAKNKCFELDGMYHITEFRQRCHCDRGRVTHKQTECCLFQ